MCIPCECSQRLNSTGEEFNNQMDTVTYSVNTSELLSPATPAPMQWTTSTSDHGGRDRGYARAPPYGLPFTKASTTISSVHFSCSVVSDSLQPVDCSTPGFPVCHQLPELAQIMSAESVMPSNHLILCHPLLLCSIFPSIRVFSNESALSIR